MKTRDGFAMEAMMIKPPDFDPTKKYPVLEFTYSGPHAPQVTERLGRRRLHVASADGPERLHHLDL